MRGLSKCLNSLDGQPYGNGGKRFAACSVTTPTFLEQASEPLFLRSELWRHVWILARWYMAEGAPQCDTMMKPKFQASQRASKQAMNKVFISILKRNDFNMPTRGFSQSDCPCRAEPRTTRLLSVHTLSAYLLCHMKKISWQISIRVIIIYYDAKGQLSSIPNYC